MMGEFLTGGQDLQEGGEEKAETGDWRPERKGRVAGGEWRKRRRWMVDWRLGIISGV